MGTCKTSLRKSTQLTKVSLICPWGSRESWIEKDFLHSRVLILSICPLIWKLLPGSLMFHACSNDRGGKILLLFITPCRVPAGKSVLPIDNFSKMSNSSSIVQQILMSHFSFYHRNQNSTIVSSLLELCSQNIKLGHHSWWKNILPLVYPWKVPYHHLAH